MSKDTIVIYPHFGQQVSSWNVDFAQGDYKIPLLKSVDTNSLILFNVHEGINPVNYNLTDRKDIFNIGDEVAVSAEVGVHVKYVVGKLASITNDYIEVVGTIDDKTKTYKIKNYNQIAVNKEPEDPYVNIDLTNLTGKLQLSYLFDGIGWKAHYNLIFNDDKIELFKLIGTVENNTGQNLSGDLVLVAGDVLKPYHDDQQTTARAMVMSELSEASVTSEKIDEHYRYNLGNKCIKNKTNVDLVSLTDIESEKYYIHNLSSYDRMDYGYKLVAPKFLPTGEIYLYYHQNEEIIYTGTSQMKEHREGDEVELVVGKTTQVQIISEISEKSSSEKVSEKSSSEKGNEKEVGINSNIKNLSSSSASVILKYYVGNSKVISSDQTPTNKKRGYLEWKLIVNPNTATQVNINLAIAELNH